THTLRLGGDDTETDDPNGVTYVRGTTGTAALRSLVGLLPSTNLGTPLPSTTPDATWTGRYYEFGSATIPSIDFNIDFEMKTINATDAEGIITTTFDLGFTAEGVITGSVLIEGLLQTNNIAPVRGLIGEKGLVGGFANQNGGSALAGTLYGGFVALPPALDGRVNHADFKAYYADSARRPEQILHPTPTTTIAQEAFVEGTPTGLPTDGLTFVANGNFAPIAVRLKEAATGDDGFAIMIGLDTDNQPRFRAGLLSGTDLGPPVPTTSTATWAGSLHFANSVSGLGRFALPTVTVDFDNGTIKAPAVTVASDRTIAIDGLFRAGSNNNTLPVGVLGGTVLYTDSGASASVTLIGLIGEEGAIGIFAQNGNSIIGGFQASPSE
ncbi:MAG: hypothetical protein K8953_08945, partial [Proteobacteria bacterium]|nr:hypothetical protein [Pseudomonadota bacterium]